MTTSRPPAIAIHSPRATRPQFMAARAYTVFAPCA